MKIGHKISSFGEWLILLSVVTLVIGFIFHIMELSESSIIYTVKGGFIGFFMGIFIIMLGGIIITINEEE